LSNRTRTPRVARLSDQPWQVGEHRLRSPTAMVSGVLVPQQADHRAELVEGLMHPRAHHARRSGDRCVSRRSCGVGPRRPGRRGRPVRTARGAVQEVGPGSVVGASLAAGLAAWASLALLERLTARPRRNWTVLAVAVLVLSLTGPLGSGIGMGTTVALACMHLVAAAVLVPGLALSRRS
jgi:hypothetical protein